MNYGISVLFRMIPLAMAFFCFLYGFFIFFSGTDPDRLTAGPIVFFLGSICIALFATAATIIRQIIGTYNKGSKIILPIIGYSCAIITFVVGVLMTKSHVASYFVAGHVIAGLGLITACVSTAATVSSKFSLIPINNAKRSNVVNKAAFSASTEKFFIALMILFSAVAWIWSFVLLAHASQTPHFVAGTVMGGLACICTSLIALVASIVRQERNVYNANDKKGWGAFVLVMGTIAMIWGLVILLMTIGETRDFVGFVMIGLGLVCYSISSKVILLAKIWHENYELASRIPLIPVLTALIALFLASFLFEAALFEPKYFVPARVIAGLGAICFTLFSIVSILESGTSKK